MQNELLTTWFTAPGTGFGREVPRRKGVQATDDPTPRRPAVLVVGTRKL